PLPGEALSPSGPTSLSARPALRSGAGLESGPVVADRTEALDEDGTVRPGSHLVGDIAQDPPAPARPDRASLLADDELGAPFQQDPELLVRMAVRRHDRARIELDEHERDALALD